MTYIAVSKVVIMAKLNKTKAYKKPLDNSDAHFVAEPSTVYNGKIAPSLSTVVKTQNFTFTKFKAIADTINLSLADWALLLYTSERTLLRYAKANVGFNGLQIERILIISQAIALGNIVFGKNLAVWFKTPSIRFNGQSPFEQLFTHGGVQSVINYIGQIQYGNVA
jgi:hypothetical protein